MTGTVIPGPWSRNPRLGRSRNPRVAEALRQLEDLKRIHRDDRMRVASNLGQLVCDLARDHAVPADKMLKQVWSVFDPKRDRWAKRLRYVRLPEDADHKSDELAGSWSDFKDLTRAIAGLRRPDGLSREDHENDVIMRCLEGTRHDPDPQRSQAIDMDAARSVGDLAGAFIARLEQAVPGLRRYFEQLARYQLFHPRHDEETLRERFLATVPAMVASDYPVWDPQDDYTGPLDLDTSRFQAVFTGDALPGHGPTDTMPEGFLRDGMWIGGGDADNNAMLGLLPRIHLGDIHVYGLAAKPAALWDEPVTDHLGKTSPATANDVIKAAAARPLRIHLVIAPVLADGAVTLSLGLIGEAWPLSQVVWDEESIGRFLVHPDWSKWPEEGEVRWGPVASLPDGLEPTRTLDLIPGQSANRLLGLQGEHGVEQSREGLDPQVSGFDQLTPELLEQRLIEVRPAIAVGVGFTPHPANTLAAALISNMLYVRGPENVLEMMAQDARERVERLEHHLEVWMQAFQAARSDFVAGVDDITSEETQT